MKNERLKTISEFEPIKKLEIINPLREYAKKLYEQDVANYNSGNSFGVKIKTICF